MRPSSLILKSWLALVMALLFWGGVAFVVVRLVEMQYERAAHASDAAAANLQQGQAAQLFALARDTAAERATLKRTASVDVLAAVKVIESVQVGSARAKVVDANADRLPSVKSGTSTVNAVALSVRAEGPFSAVMRILQMLETLPIATTVQAIDISRLSPDTSVKNPPIRWALNVRLRLLTTTSLSI